MTGWEHLDLLRAHVETRVPEVALFLPPGARILEARRRGRPGVFVAWDRHEAAYTWVDGPDAGARVGADAEQAAEQIGRLLA